MREHPLPDSLPCQRGRELFTPSRLHPSLANIMSVLEVKVPDIGDFKEIPIIEILVKAGDSVNAEDPLIALESDKATMEVPAPQAGTVKEIKVKVGDKVSKGTLVLTLDA